MFDKFLNETQNNFKPFMDLCQLNLSTTEKMMRQNAQFVTDAMSAGFAQGQKNLTEKDPSAVLAATQAYAQDLGQKVAGNAKANFDALNEYKDAATKLVSESSADLARHNPIASLVKAA